MGPVNPDLEHFSISSVEIILVAVTSFSSSACLFCPAMNLSPSFMRIIFICSSTDAILFITTVSGTRLASQVRTPEARVPKPGQPTSGDTIVV